MSELNHSAQGFAGESAIPLDRGSVLTLSGSKDVALVSVREIESGGRIQALRAEQAGAAGMTRLADSQVLISGGDGLDGVTRRASIHGP